MCRSQGPGHWAAHGSPGAGGAVGRGSALGWATPTGQGGLRQEVLWRPCSPAATCQEPRFARPPRSPQPLAAQGERAPCEARCDLLPPPPSKGASSSVPPCSCTKALRHPPQPTRVRTAAPGGPSLPFARGACVWVTAELLLSHCQGPSGEPPSHRRTGTMTVLGGVGWGAPGDTACPPSPPTWPLWACSLPAPPLTWKQLLPPQVPPQPHAEPWWPQSQLSGARKGPLLKASRGQAGKAGVGDGQARPLGLCSQMGPSSPSQDTPGG